MVSVVPFAVQKIAVENSFEFPVTFEKIHWWSTPTHSTEPEGHIPGVVMISAAECLSQIDNGTPNDAGSSAAGQSPGIGRFCNILKGFCMFLARTGWLSIKINAAATQGSIEVRKQLYLLLLRVARKVLCLPTFIPSL
mmetsp:Transcript_8835/g.24462  ORF Transcript_8835/g.24462 Transcript_8835/m.24462 type:complete len:138 (+) Transcript_8835:2181-2594(+)